MGHRSRHRLGTWTWIALLVQAALGCATTAGARGEGSVGVVPEATLASAEDEGYFAGERRARIADKAPARDQAPVPESEAPDGRSVIYSAFLRLAVVSGRDALASVRAFAEEAGGHLQESDARSITVRVPAERFEAVVARIETLGEVVDRNVRASDVTEEMLDLGIRLENARKARERLLDHLAKSEKIEDTLAIEKELARVTEEIERMEGRQRFLQSQIAMSTIRVEVNVNDPDRAEGGLVLPFEWIERLGDGLLAGTVKSLPRKPSLLSSGPRFDPPPGFVRYFRSRDLVEAMDAEGVRLKVQKLDNYDKGALSFWCELARRALVQRRSLAVTEERELSRTHYLISGTREVAGEPYGYLLVLVRQEAGVFDDGHILTFEAWGPAEAIERERAALLESAGSL